MSTPAELRAACYAMLRAARTEADCAVKRILAAHALAIAQEAELRNWSQEEARPKAPSPGAPPGSGSSIA